MSELVKAPAKRKEEKKKIVANTEYIITPLLQEGRASVNIKEKETGAIVFQFSCGIHGTPFCCGLKEMGSFQVYSYKKTSAEIETEAVRQLFEKIPAEYTKGNGRCITIVFTLIGETQGCKLVKKAIEGNTVYKKVKTFVNSNSGIENELYIINN